MSQSITISQDSLSLVITDQENAVLIAAQNILKGDKGDTGNSASTFVFNQAIASNVWTIPHNLNKYPSVTVVIGGLEVIPDIGFIDQNIVQITHGIPLTGTVYCN